MDAEPPSPDIGRIVKDRRIERGWTQARLVEESGVSDKTVRLVEAGGPDGRSRHTLRSLSIALWGDPNHLQRLTEGGGAAASGGDHPSLEDRLTRLEEQVSELRDMVAAATEALNDALGQRGSSPTGS